MLFFMYIHAKWDLSVAHTALVQGPGVCPSGMVVYDGANLLKVGQSIEEAVADCFREELPGF